MSTLNVLRYSVLGAGILYGFTHDRGLKKDAHNLKLDNEYKEKELLIQKAKEEFVKSKLPKQITTTTSSSLTNIDLNDPKVDFAQIILASVESLN